MKQLTMWRILMDEVDFMDTLIATQNRVIDTSGMDLKRIMKDILMLIAHLHDRINTMEMETEDGPDEC